MGSKIILITGSTGGIGFQAALELTQMAEEVIIHGRNLKKAKDAAQVLKSQLGTNSVDCISGDFTSLAEISAMAEDLHQKYSKLDVLLNNAGVWEKERHLTQDGFEFTFQINHLAHFMLTLLLLDLLKNAAPSRVVNVASTAAANALDFDNLQGEISFNGYMAYATSKLCNVLFTFELATRVRDYQITANCLHPGVFNTKLMRNGLGASKPIGEPVENSAKMHLYLATAPELSDVSGEFFVNQQPSRAGVICYDAKVRKNLWHLSEEMVNLKLHNIMSNFD